MVNHSYNEVVGSQLRARDLSVVTPEAVPSLLTVEVGSCRRIQCWKRIIQFVFGTIEEESTRPKRFLFVHTTTKNFLIMCGDF